MSGRRRIIAAALVCAALTASTEAFAGTVPAAPAPGSLKEFDIPSADGEPAAITSGPDGALWFTEVLANKVARIGTNGRFKEFTVPSGVGGIFTSDIAAGADGNLWFVGNSFVGRITPTGALTEFSLPRGTATKITAGPDGNMWFAQNSNRGSHVGRITPAGAITLYKVSSDGYALYGITTGPDGNLWFTEFSNARALAKIGRLTPGPTVRVDEFRIPTLRAEPQGIAVGPGGDLWFAENGKNKIGRITTAGVITEYPIPLPHSKPTAISAGSDGNMWFVQQRDASHPGARIARIAPDGTVTEFQFPRVGRLWDITSGPDGNLWLTDLGDAVARFVPPVVSSAHGARR